MGRDEGPRQPPQARPFFRDAAALFAPAVRSLERFDESHADAETRSIAIGEIARGVIMVVYTERDGDVVRIISARWATPAERRRYHAYAKKET